MTGRFETPAAFKHSLDTRIRSEAERRGWPIQRLRQLVVFERLLARLFAIFGDDLVLKGGIVVELRLARARTTKDVDLRVLGSPELLLDRLREAGQLDLGDFMTFEVRPDAKHAELDIEGLRYGGRRFRAEAKLAGKIFGSSFGIDVALAEPHYGEVERLSSDQLIALEGIEPTELRVYPVEAHIAEKLHALTLPRTRPNSRVKDLPDIALLASLRPMDGGELRRAIELTFSERGTHEVPRRLDQPPENWAAVYLRMAGEDRLPWPNIDSLAAAVREFVEPVLEDGHGRWNPDTWSWEAIRDE